MRDAQTTAARGGQPMSLILLIRVHFSYFISKFQSIDSTDLLDSGKWAIYILDKGPAPYLNCEPSISYVRVIDPVKSDAMFCRRERGTRVRFTVRRPNMAIRGHRASHSAVKTAANS